MHRQVILKVRCPRPSPSWSLKTLVANFKCFLFPQFPSISQMWQCRPRAQILSCLCSTLKPVQWPCNVSHQSHIYQRRIRFPVVEVDDVNQTFSIFFASPIPGTLLDTSARTQLGTDRNRSMTSLLVKASAEWQTHAWTDWTQRGLMQDDVQAEVA